jgi:2-iminobutanoate/2-iminopropanoate deaminase
VPPLPSGPTPRAWRHPARFSSCPARPADIKGQTAQCLKNIQAIVEAAGASLADVVRVGAFLKDLADFSAFNEVYATFFSQPYPARTTVQAAPPGCLVEMDAIVRLKT